MQVVITQGGVNRNAGFTPHGCFIVPDLPVVLIIAIVGNIPADRNKGWMSSGNGLDQSPARQRVRCLRILEIGKPRITVSYETERHAQVQLKLSRLRQRRLDL